MTAPSPSSATSATSPAAPLAAAAHAHAHAPSAAELLFADFEPELKATRRMLERFPAGKGDWRPHEKSRTLAQLATHIADLPSRGTTALTTGERDVTQHRPMAPLSDSTELLALFDRGAAELLGALADTDLDALARPFVLRAGPKVLVQQPKRVALRTIMMSHLVHHRAQLGVYYRLLGVPVPGMYGPSADDAPPPAR